MLRGIVGGLFGGLLGAGAWTLATAISGTQSGLGVWLVGLLAGVGFTLAIRREGDARAGWAALAVALVSIIAGTAAGGAWAVEPAPHATQGIADEPAALAHLERTIQRQWTEQGRVLAIGAGRAVNPEVRAEAAAQWARLSPADRIAYAQSIGEPESEAARGLFAGVLSGRWALLNALWFVLALATAFKVAAHARPRTAGDVRAAASPVARREHEEDLSSVSWGRRPTVEVRRRAA